SPPGPARRKTTAQPRRSSAATTRPSRPRADRDRPAAGFRMISARRRSTWTASSGSLSVRGQRLLLRGLARLRRGLDHFEELVARPLIGNRVIGADQFDRFRALQARARLAL